MDDVTNDDPITQPCENIYIFMNDFEHDNPGINNLYTRILGFHENPDIHEDDLDDNIVTILGLVSESEINHLNHDKVRKLVKIIHPYNETGMSDEKLSTLKIGHCRKSLQEERHQLLQMSVH